MQPAQSEVVLQLRDKFVQVHGFEQKRRLVNVLFSFMYFNCDLGKKP